MDQLPCKGLCLPDLGRACRRVKACCKSASVSRKLVGGLAFISAPSSADIIDGDAPTGSWPCVFRTKRVDGEWETRGLAIDHWFFEQQRLAASGLLSSRGRHRP